MRTRWPTDPRFPYLNWWGDPDKPRIAYNRPGYRKTELKARPWFGPAFEAEYNAARDVRRLPTVEKRQLNGKEIKPRPGGTNTVNAMVTAYFEGDHFKSLAESTRREWRRWLETILARKAPCGRTYGETPYHLVDFYSVSRLYKLIAVTEGKRGKAVNFLAAFSAVWTWAMEAEFDRAIKVNPCKGVKRVGAKGPGHLTWQPEHIEHVLASCPEGSEMHNMVTGFLYTGARGSDFVRINDDMIIDVEDEQGNLRKMISFEPVKNRERKRREGKETTWAYIPILPPLQKLLDARPPGQTHLFVTRLGNVIKRATAANKLRLLIKSLDWGEGVEAPRLTPHGLRKACTMFLLRSKPAPTHEEVAAIMGWKDVAMVAYYAAEFDREAAALKAMPSFSIPPVRRRPKLRVVG